MDGSHAGSEGGARRFRRVSFLLHAVRVASREGRGRPGRHEAKDHDLNRVAECLERPSSAVLLLAHGGPSRLEDIPLFLKTLSGRDPTEETVQRVTERYRHLGGGSPAPGFVLSIAGKLEQSCGLPVYPGQLHWHPLIEDVVPRMAAEQVLKALAVCLVPHFSPAGVGRYQRRALAACRAAGIALDLVDSWHMEPAYVDAIVESVARACATLSSPESESVSVLGTAHVVFTAHSLPVAATGAGDPYQSQLRETAVLVAERTGLDQDGWTLAFQGAVGHTERWLGPAVEDVLASLSSRGVRRVVLCPFGFVLDQVEILYDIDVALRGRARELGMELVRTPTLNDSAPLVEVLAGLVEGWEAAAEKGRLA